MATLTPRLAMLGPAPGTRDGVASVIEAYREQGLFARWPADYLATYGDGGLRSNAALLARALRRFVPLLARERALIVHLHAASERGLWRDALFAALAAALGRPFILHLHGAGWRSAHERGGGLVRFAIRLALERAAGVVVPCEAMRTWARGVTRGAQVEVVPPPLAAEEPAPYAPRPNVVLFLSRLEAAKGVFDLLEAFAGLRAAVPDARLVCAGEGERDAAAHLAAQLGIADAVKFTGWVGPSGKRALLENAAVFALPSYDEGLPMGLLEAMLAGVPAVVSPVGGVPEVVADETSGLWAAPGDVVTLQRQLTRLLADRDLGARIGAAARKSAARRCDPQRTLALIGALYAELGLAALAAAPRHTPAH
jgi:glycosyltransferase involved in cell wall biosynthesis